MTRHANQGTNDNQIRQAISYISEEGRADSYEKFQDRVNLINDNIVHRYTEGSYDFNPNLYRQLRSMVNQKLNEFQRVPSARATELSDDSELLSDSEDIEDMDLSDDALLRQESDTDPSEVIRPPSKPRSQSRGKAKTPEPAPAGYPARRSAPASASALPEEIIPENQKQYLYGGPRNETEEWLREFAPMLPFGETLRMQEWESMKINYDLAQGAMKKTNGKDPVVPKPSFKKLVKESQPINIYDSGSRFKLPINDRLLRTIENKYPIDMEAAVNEFNNIDPKWNETLEAKDYLPRIFLEKVQFQPDMARIHITQTFPGPARTERHATEASSARFPRSAGPASTRKFSSASTTHQTSRPTGRNAGISKAAPVNHAKERTARRLANPRTFHPNPPPRPPKRGATGAAPIGISSGGSSEIESDDTNDIPAQGTGRPLQSVSIPPRRSVTATAGLLSATPAKGSQDKRKFSVTSNGSVEPVYKKAKTTASGRGRGRPKTSEEPSRVQPAKKPRGRHQEVKRGTTRSGTTFKRPSK